jgi:hypothetical protein
MLDEEFEAVNPYKQPKPDFKFVCLIDLLMQSTSEKAPRKH